MFLSEIPFQFCKLHIKNEQELHSRVWAPHSSACGEGRSTQPTNEVLGGSSIDGRYGAYYLIYWRMIKQQQYYQMLCQLNIIFSYLASGARVALRLFLNMGQLIIIYSHMLICGRPIVCKICKFNNNNQKVVNTIIRVLMITDGQFCYWDCKSDGDAIILIVNSLFTLVLLALAILSYSKLNKIPKAQLQSFTGIKAKYVGIIAWAIISILNTVFAITVYYKVLEQVESKKDKSEITFYSRIYAFIETTPAMIVQTLLLTTAETMITNGMGVLLEQQHQPTKDEMKKYKFISRYYKIRLVFFACWLTLLIPFPNPVIYEILTQIKILMLMTDCAIIVWLLRFCHNYMLDKSQKLLPSNQSQRKKLSRETKLLIICGACRFVVNLTFYIVFPLLFIKDNQNQTPKPCIQEIGDHIQFSIGYLIIGTYLMHHLSIIVLLKIYKPSSNRQSLIRISQTQPFNFQRR